MIKRYLPLLFIAAVTALTSCKREKDNRYPGDLSRAFWPLQQGRYVVYDVDSTIWNDFDGTKKERHHQMRYSVADTFRDAQERLSYQMDIHIRPNDSAAWRIDDVFFVTPTPAGLEVVQNNLRFIKLTFPVKEGATWKGNSNIATNDQDLSYFFNWDYKVHHVGQTYNNGRVKFENTAIVDLIDEKQNDPESMPTAYAFRTFGREVYGHDVGLIYRELLHWTYDPTPGSQAARKGYSVVMRAIDHN